MASGVSAVSTFEVGSRVWVSVPGANPFAATVSRVVMPTGAIGGLFEVVADDGRRFPSGADWFAGDWLRHRDRDASDAFVFAHPDALVAIGGGA